MSHDAIISVTLKDVAAVSAGHPLRGSAEALDEGEAPFIQLKDTNPAYGIDWESVLRVDLPSTRSPKWLGSNDVIFSARGSRNFGYAMNGVLERSVCSPHFFVLSIVDTNTLNPEFLAWQLNQKPAQEYFKRTAVGTQAVTTIRRPALEALPLIVPPLRDQELIAEFSRAAIREQAALKQLIENRTRQSDAIAFGLHTHAKEAGA